MKFGEIALINNMKLFVRIILFASVALGASIGLWYYLNGYLAKTKASESIAHFAFSSPSKKAKGGDVVQVGVTVTAPSGISAVDISFDTSGSNLNFLYPESTAQLPIGFDAQLLNEGMMVSRTPAGLKNLKRMIFVSKKSTTTLPKSIFIPLHFAVVNVGQGASQSVLSVNLASSQVSGPAIPGNLFTLAADTNPPTFTLEMDDPRVAPVMSLECDIEKNYNRANCGKGIGIKWADSANEDGYKIFRNNILIKSVGKDATSYVDMWCATFEANTYSVVSYNSLGSATTLVPSVSCGCLICPTVAPPTPTPMRAENSSDLIFKVIFPDAAPLINEIQNVRVSVLDVNGNRVCDGDTDCATVVSFKRVIGARIPNTFSSPQLQFPTLKKTQPYTIVVKQNHTVKQSYKQVYLKWQKVLQCLEGSQDTGCGELIETGTGKVLFSGDLDGSNTVDQLDANKITLGIGVQSAEGDLNFDGITDQKDIEILGKNFSKKGN